MSPGLHVADALTATFTQAVQRAAGFLHGLQRPEGFWWGDLTADATLEADWFLLLLWMHPPRNGEWNPPNREQMMRAVDSILARQLPDGGFNIYPHGPSEISASVKVYFALKLAGLPEQSQQMTRLRDCILRLGGVQAANSYTKINLALFGLYPGEHVPSIPPEMMLLPGQGIYRMSSWTRAIVVPLSILHATTIAQGKTRPVPTGFHLREIFHPDRPLSAPEQAPLFSWRRFFLFQDRALKFYEKHPVGQLRQNALAKAKAWILERFAHSEGLGAIYPAMQYAVMALEALGLPPDSPQRLEAQQQFDNLIFDDGKRFFFQPCFSPVWDTAIAAFALGEAGAGAESALQRAGDWLLSKEVRRKGDWSVQRPDVEPSGWYFEFANEFYPDIDDTAMVLLGLAHARPSSNQALDACIQRAVNWMKSMQARDGGWAAFDVDNGWKPLSQLPFADHNAMLDPTCSDITGRAVEALVRWGVDPSSETIRKAVDYLVRSQEADGSWYGRWGVNYIYGTCHALRALRAAGMDDREAVVLRAGEWLRSIQNADGGWGESCESYDRGTFVPAKSTPSQTAWALLGLIAGGDTTSESVIRGAEYLVETQRPDGSWDEDLATGTGFPCVFYLSYHLYRTSFPVLALAEFIRTRQPQNGMNGVGGFGSMGLVQ